MQFHRNIYRVHIYCWVWFRMWVIRWRCSMFIHGCYGVDTKSMQDVYRNKCKYSTLLAKYQLFNFVYWLKFQIDCHSGNSKISPCQTVSKKNRKHQHVSSNKIKLYTFFTCAVYLNHWNVKMSTTRWGQSKFT